MKNAQLRIAVAGGKGGTGKTTVSANLVSVLSDNAKDVVYVDCDVEEPNGHLFFKPDIQRTATVKVSYPEINENKCTKCGNCATACRYTAIAALPNKTLTFPKLCHGCGGCFRVCPHNAIAENFREVGQVEAGVSGRLTFVHGRLNVGEAMSPPVIREVLRSIPPDRIAILDAPPGTSCPVIESVKTADVVLLVTEPTPFGLNDFRLVADMVKALGLPFGAVINRAGIGNNEVKNYCIEQDIPILLEIPNDRKIAQAYSRGVLATKAFPEMGEVFLKLFNNISALSNKTTSGSVLKSEEQSSFQKLETPLPIEFDNTAINEDDYPSKREPVVNQKKPSELVVISGKGGTGKTSVTASLFYLAQNASAADCDVDAADLHLVLNPSVQYTWPFSGGQTSFIDREKCTACGICQTHCRFDAVTEKGGFFVVDHISCEGCGVCEDVCPNGAAQLRSVVNGEWFVSDTRMGPMTHAKLGIAQENSGKLVSLVRREGRFLGALNRRELLICDGSPGVGCPVIASIAGANMALIVTEPTLSGLHDLKRAAELCKQFLIKTGICINKADINLEVCEQIEKEAASLGIPVFGRIRYDDAVVHAQINQQSVVEYSNGPAASDIRELFKQIQKEIFGPSL